MLWGEGTEIRVPSPILCDWVEFSTQLAAAVEIAVCPLAHRVET